MDKVEVIWDLISLVGLSETEKQMLIGRLNIDNDLEIILFKVIMAECGFKSMEEPFCCIRMVKWYMNKTGNGLKYSKEWWDCYAYRLGFRYSENVQFYKERYEVLKLKYPERF